MRSAYGISSDLTGQAYEAVWAIWDDLDRRYGLRAAQVAVNPHVTYVVGDGSDADGLAELVGAAAAEIAPFEIEIDGIGTFDGERPVVYLRVVKDPALVRAYETIRAAMQSAGCQIWPVYEPELWIPHVTLALQDTSAALLPALLADLDECRTHYTTRLQAVSLVQVAEPDYSFIGTYSFGSAGHARSA